MIRIKNLNKKENGKHITMTERKVAISDDEKDIRQFSLMAGELLPELREVRGLCTKRFWADIETEGLDYASLSVGNVLRFDSVCLQITQKGKRCFDECPIRCEGRVCPLPANVAFARVVQGGRLKVHASGTKTFEV